MKVLFIGGSGIISSACTALAVDAGIDLYLLNRGRTDFRPIPAAAHVLPADIRELAHSILRNPKNVHVAPVSSAAERIEQAVYHVAKRNKSVLLQHLLKSSAATRTLVFTRTMAVYQPGTFQTF